MRQVVNTTVRESQCIRTATGAVADADDLGWPIGKWPTAILWVAADGTTRILRTWRVVPDGDRVGALLYWDDDDFWLEVVSGRGVKHA